MIKTVLVQSVFLTVFSAIIKVFIPANKYRGLIEQSLYFVFVLSLLSNVYDKTLNVTWGVLETDHEASYQTYVDQYESLGRELLYKEVHENIKAEVGQYLMAHHDEMFDFDILMKENSGQLELILLVYSKTTLTSNLDKELFNDLTVKYNTHNIKFEIHVLEEGESYGSLKMD